MKTHLLISALLTAPLTLDAASSQILGWNNLGMHCMDSDYSVFSILPPYNTIEAQLIVNGRLVTNGVGYSVTYEAVADLDGSINTTAQGKGNFSQYVQPLYGATIAPDHGLTPWPMPGLNNTPQPMLFERTNAPAPGAAVMVNWFRAEGIPITPYDDAGRKNPYPMMRLIARAGGGAAIATNDVVLPVSDEMDCRLCHASGTQPAARPAAGWVWSANPERDYRLNILRLHDQHQFEQHAGLYQAALSARGFTPKGLYASVSVEGRPVLCATCHASEALGTASYSNIPPLTASVHIRHAQVLDPVLNVTLDHTANRAACYRCHPGSTTKCLRGAMGGAVAADGTMEMQCQSCHGGMATVGSASRVGWFMEPNCQSCHTGTATRNNGQIRFVTAFETNGQERVAADLTFATNPDTPAHGISLFRFSKRHGGLQCEACHGSTHAEFPSTHRSDNLRNERIQGHAGVMVECTACHSAMPSTVSGGPHGMHPLGGSWAMNHGDLFEGGAPAATRQQCQACHGAGYRGTVLSRMQAARTITTKYGARTFWRGQQIGCYECHNGANSSDPVANSRPVVANVSAAALSGGSVAISLPGSDANGQALTFRIVSQPSHGTAGVSGNVATYFAEPGYVGSDSFTFAANDGYADSNLGTGTVEVAQGPFSIGAAARVPSSWPSGWPVPFGALATPSNTVAAVVYEWDFGDGSAHDARMHASHTYAAPGVYEWSLLVRASTAQASVRGSVTIDSPMGLSPAGVCPSQMAVEWPRSLADSVLEYTPSLQPALWKPVTNSVLSGADAARATLQHPGRTGFYRLRLVE